MADGLKSGFSAAVTSFFEYDTPKIVHIKSKKVGLINRVIQLGILGYIIGYAIVWEKGYQEKDSVVSATSTKVKGVSFTNLSEAQNPGLGARIWDVADYVIPPQENDAVFVMTNAIVTFNQTQGKCPEDFTKPDALCKTDKDCLPAKVPIANGNGVRTGFCVPSAENASIRVCEIYAWCPVEKDDGFPIPDKPLIQNAEDFTVLLKNQIEFPKFNVSRRNILDTYNKTYLEKCRYNSSDVNDRFCPIFTIGSIVDEAGQDMHNLSMSGGFILVKIEWDCNLDKSIDQCVPKYSFRRLDDPFSKIAKGWNFRYANYYYEQGVEYRDLIKAYGIRFIIKVTGEAGKFSLVPLLLNIGSGIGLLAVATVLCDILTMYVLKKGDYYLQRKYLFVEDADKVPGSRGVVLVDNEREPLAVDQGPRTSYQATDSSAMPPMQVCPSCIRTDRRRADPTYPRSDEDSTANRRRYAKLEEDD